jgi:serine/threonine-protein kinase
VTVQLQQIELNAGQVVADRYAIEKELGKGGMGRVYLAHQRPFDRPVVIKIMHPKYLADDRLRQRFFNEARAASQLSHPNSITVFDFGKTDDDIYFIAMEYVDGVTLRKALSTDGPMPLERAVPIIVQVAQSLGEAHRKGIIHRDLKPENIMLGRPGTADEFVKVLDFGIAKVLDNQTGITQTGSVFGTPGYMAPEQGRAEEIDQTVDLYSLTCCFYELLTGKMPFGGESALHVMMQHQSDPVPPLPSGFRAGLDAFMTEGLAKTAGGRPKTADDYVTRLLSYLREDGETGLRGTPRNGSERPSSGEFVRGTPAPADRSSGNLDASSGSLPSPSDIRNRDDEKVEGSNPSPPPRSLDIPSPDDASAVTQKPTARVDSGPLRKELEQADTRPSRDSDRLRTPGGTPRYASPAPERTESSPTLDQTTASRDSRPDGPPPTRPDRSTPGVASSVANPNTETWPQREPPNNNARYWALAATIIAGFLTVAVVMLNWDGDDRGAQADVESSKSNQSRSVTIDSQPSSALVIIDGLEVGITPTDYSAEPGDTLDVELSKPGYFARKLRHTVSADTAEQRVFAALDPRSLRLSIASPVEGAEVQINGESYGKLPANRPKEVEVRWPTDQLEVVIRHPEYEDYIARLPASTLDDRQQIKPSRSDLVRRTDDG